MTPFKRSSGISIFENTAAVRILSFDLFFAPIDYDIHIGERLFCKLFIDIRIVR